MALLLYSDDVVLGFNFFASNAGSAQIGLSVRVESRELSRDHQFGRSVTLVMHFDFLYGMRHQKCFVEATFEFSDRDGRRTNSDVASGLQKC